MGNAPPDAMSSPYCQGGELSDLIKNSNYFKDATFNTEQKFEDLSDSKKIEILEAEKKKIEEAAKAVSEPIPAILPATVFQPSIKNCMLKILMDNKIDIDSVSDTKIEFTFAGSKFLILPC